MGDNNAARPTTAADRSGAPSSSYNTPRGSGLSDDDNGADADHRRASPRQPLSPTSPRDRSGATAAAQIHPLPSPQQQPAQQPGMRFLDVVRTVQQLQRREKLLKMQSNRTLVSVGSASIDNRSGTHHVGRVASQWPASTERSSLLSHPPTGGGSSMDGGLAPGESRSRAPGRIPSVIGTSATAASIPEYCGTNGTLANDDSDHDNKSILLQPITACQAIWAMIFGKGWLSYLLLAAPFVLLAVHLDWGDTWVFWLSFLVMIPLASILSDFTEEAALHTNETIGGLLNASFGNAVEVVVAVQALLANEIRVVQASMLGSILSNLLLVLGCCFFFGGLYHKEQSFNATGATANMGLLALSSIAMVLPTPYADYYVLHDEHVLKVSRLSAVFLLFMYLQLLIFQLKTHAHLFDDDNNDDDNDTQLSPTPSDDSNGAASSGAGRRTEAPTLSLGASLLGLAGTTLLVTLFSEHLVRSIDGFVDSSGISRTFVGLILLPIVGNAVEHVSAVTVAIKDKMDLAMGVAVGSCTQISLLVVPLTVLVGWALDKPMTLNFPHFEIIMYIMSVLTVSIVLSNPRCNWLEGSLLITTYLLIAVGFWFEEVQNF